MCVREKERERERVRSRGFASTRDLHSVPKQLDAIQGMAGTFVSAIHVSKQPYAVQGMAGTFVSAIHGDYFNVVGFPTHRFAVELARLVMAGLLPS